MSLAVLLILVGTVLVLVDIVLNLAPVAYSKLMLTSVGTLLIGISLLISSGVFHA